MGISCRVVGRGDLSKVSKREKNPKIFGIFMYQIGFSKNIHAVYIKGSVRASIQF